MFGACALSVPGLQTENSNKNPFVTGTTKLRTVLSKQTYKLVIYCFVAKKFYKDVAGTNNNKCLSVNECGDQENVYIHTFTFEVRVQRVVHDFVVRRCVCCLLYTSRCV